MAKTINTKNKQINRYCGGHGETIALCRPTETNGLHFIICKLSFYGQTKEQNKGCIGHQLYTASGLVSIVYGLDLKIVETV